MNKKNIEQKNTDLLKLKETPTKTASQKSYEKNIIVLKNKLQFDLNPVINLPDIENQLAELEAYIYRSDFNICDYISAEDCIDLISKSAADTSEIIPEQLKLKFYELREYLNKLRRKNMALIPTAEIFVGSNFHNLNEKPVFKIEVAQFYLDIAPVSVKSFVMVCPEYKHYLSDYKYHDEPARGINWNQANIYARRIGKRLPTELEWMRAAQGLEKFVYSTGNTADTALIKIKSDWFNYRLSASENHNIFGLYHLTGLVWEWCDDWYLPYPGNHTNSDNYGYKYKILKGGCWRSNDDESRNNFRNYKPQHYSDETIGFRCAI